jgi:hypothetical protein
VRASTSAQIAAIEIGVGEVSAHKRAAAGVAGDAPRLA